MESRSDLPNLAQVYPSSDHGSQGFNVRVDIIAVHGIETESPRTWRYEEEGRVKNWITDEDMLARIIPGTRVWTYNYNSNCYSDNAQEVDIQGLGESFLGIVASKFGTIGQNPIIFIGSCFGGILVTQILCKAAKNEARYAQLLRSTAGVVFLGTPLRGTPVATQAQWVAFVRGLAGKEVSDTLLRDLEENDRRLGDITQEFAALAIDRRLQVRCFYETRPTSILKRVLPSGLAKMFKGTQLVGKYSACLDGHPQIPLEGCNHSLMNKFSGPSDGKYLLISQHLREIFDSYSAFNSLSADESKCLQSLSNNYLRGKELNKKRLSGTCKWVLDHPIFHTWCQNQSSFLWISANPGCGKSVLSRALVDDRLVTSSAHSASVCYFFFKEDDDSQQDGAHALSAILHQLLTLKPRLIKHALPKFRAHGQKLAGMFDDLWDIFLRAATDTEAGDIVCVLDALDECQERERSRFIEKLKDFHLSCLNKSARTKIIATSRPYPEIERAFRSASFEIPIIRLRGEGEAAKISKEINLVIEHEVDEICKTREPPLKPETQMALVEELKRVDNRTYLWLHLILAEIRGSLKSTKSRLTQLIKELPHTVEEAYEKILRRAGESDRAVHARRFLHIVVAAPRPLTLREMRIALTIDEEIRDGRACRSYYELDLPEISHFLDEIRGICGLFVAVHNERIYLIHQTARTFLVAQNDVAMTTGTNKCRSESWKHILQPQESNLVLVKICIAYLLLCELDRANSRTEDWPPEYDFLGYAAVQWSHHFRQSQVQGHAKLTLSVLEVCDIQSRHFRRWFGVYWSSSRFFRKCPQRLTILLVASFLGLSKVVEQLLARDGIEINAADEYGMTPLHWAAWNGHAEVVQQLLARDGIKINAADKHGRTPLHRAAWSGHAEVVQRLLARDGIKINAADEDGRTPLYRAAWNGHTEVVQQLLARDGIEINAADKHGRTPFCRAMKSGHNRVVQQLMKATHQAWC